MNVGASEDITETIDTMSEFALTEQIGNWLTSPEQSPRGIKDSEFRSRSHSERWRVLCVFGGLSLSTPLLFITAPAMFVFGQFLLGCGLAVATWVIVKFPTEKAKERLASDRVQPEMHLVLGTLLPELAVFLEKLLLWIDLALRGYRLPAYVRYPILNLIAWWTGPLWFSILLLALVFVLLVLTVISFGLILPFTLPLIGLLLGYSLLVPVWVLSVYFFSASPLLAATVVGVASECIDAWSTVRKQALSRRLVKQRPLVTTAAASSASSRAAAADLLRLGPGGGARRETSPAAEPQQRNPSSGAGWLSKQELLALYQQRGLLDNHHDCGGPGGGSESPGGAPDGNVQGRANSGVGGTAL